MRRQHGFTLLEVVLATALLAGGLLLGFAAVRAGTAAGQRGEARALENERMRAVHDLLRARLQTALPVPFAPAVDGRFPPRFDGGGDRLRFVAEVPDWFGQGGPYLHDLQVRREPGGQDLELVLALAPVRAGGTVAAPALPPERLAGGLAAVELRYRGLDRDSGQPGPWQAQWRWEEQQRPPLLVGVTVRPRQGPAWPELLVALPRGGR